MLSFIAAWVKSKIMIHTQRNSIAYYYFSYKNIFNEKNVVEWIKCQNYAVLQVMQIKFEYK